MTRRPYGLCGNNEVAGERGREVESEEEPGDCGSTRSILEPVDVLPRLHRAVAAGGLGAQADPGTAVMAAMAAMRDTTWQRCLFVYPFCFLC